MNGNGPTNAFAIGLNVDNVNAAATPSRTSPNRTPSNRCATGMKITMNTTRLNTPAIATSIPEP
ncbi:hypothetical protein ABZS29_02330 [Kribbella sp. NPDC005582]|uniref:hypothetical protein n=1 Tax=Kribbella sp. NPDC005582 TaxID=3156893 RepID=UPI0033A3FDD2